MDPTQFLRIILQPTLRYLGLSSVASEQLMFGTALHESAKLKYIKQKGGPALGVYQMEPATYRDLANRLDDSFSKTNWYDRLMSLRPRRYPGWPPSEYMAANHEWATAMARIFYYLKPEPMPSAHDIARLASYYKRHWNTPKGRASAEDFHFVLAPYLDEWPRT